VGRNGDEVKKKVGRSGCLEIVIRVYFFQIFSEKCETFFFVVHKNFLLSHPPPTKTMAVHGPFKRDKFDNVMFWCHGCEDKHFDELYFGTITYGNKKLTTCKKCANALLANLVQSYTSGYTAEKEMDYDVIPDGDFSEMEKK
jgi:hypothetical protein